MKRMRIVKLTAVLAFAVVARGACSSVPTPSTSVPTPSTSEDIGVFGGALSLSGGGSVEVPPGALSATTKITIQTATAPADAGFNVVGPFYQFGPAGQVFDAAVTVRIPISAYAGGDAGIADHALLTVVWSDGGGWSRIPTWVDTETWSVVALVKGFSSGGAVKWGSDACNTMADCPSGGAAFCVMGQIVRSSCGPSQKCVTTTVEDCVSNGKHCVEGACVGGTACSSPTDCEAAGAAFCEGTSIVQASCIDGRCAEIPLASCENPAAPQTCANGACVSAATCVNDSTCADGGAAFCSGDKEVSRWQCVNGACLPRTVESCWHGGKVCIAGACAIGGTCTTNAACPDGGARFCDDDDVVAWRCSLQSDLSAKCQRWVQESCEVRGMRCAAGACVVVDAGAGVDAGAAVDAGSDAGVASCGCGPSDARPDGGRIVVGDAGCTWTDATLCTAWHSVVDSQDAGLNWNSLFPSGTEYTYVVQPICNIKILCP